MMPEFLESQETIEWLGWTPDKAAEIWDAWKITKSTEDQQGTIFEVEFISKVLGYIPRQVLEDSSSDWEEHMRVWGISEELIAAIMDVEFTDVRCTKSAQYWVTETMEIRYLSLERIKEESDQRTINNHTINPSVASSAVPRNTRVPGLQTLFKAISTERLKYRDGKINVGSLVSEGATDFRGYGAALYFAPDYQVADQYRQYIRRRAETTRALVIQLTLPNSWIEALPPPCDGIRRSLEKSGTYLSPRLRYDRRHEIYSQFALIIAPIAHSPNKAIARLENGRKWAFGTS
ncbi:uncharacterized protein EAF02_007709 [Botrytis sinoallii]|uniref:uncharacterized protein n=1 Tax=Botrytis sinoallii TaxID=1463999 RepID=UPI0018FFF06B|nr:uncharacterized protein EAF02_007709 [Botrytis sinoallii]KAF7880072.1 hypothetical protein EAF02_007709 [Botrytis sinoallii]